MHYDGRNEAPLSMPYIVAVDGDMTRHTNIDEGTCAPSLTFSASSGVQNRIQTSSSLLVASSEDEYYKQPKYHKAGTVANGDSPSRLAFRPRPDAIKGDNTYFPERRSS